MESKNMITAINFSDLSYKYLDTYNTQDEEETDTQKEETTKHEGITQSSISQKLNENYNLVQSLISQYTTNSQSADIYNKLVSTNNIFTRYITKFQGIYKEQLTTIGNELLDLQNQLAELVSSAEATSESDKTEEYINNYITLYNKLAEKKEEYNNLTKITGMSDKEISNQFGDKYSNEDETFGNLLSSKTSLQKIPAELADIATDIIENTTERKIIAYEMAELSTSDTDSDEMDKLNDEDLQLELQANAYLKQFKEIAQSNNFTQTNMFKDMFKTEILTLQAESSDYSNQIDKISSKMSEIQTQLKTETDSDEKERLQAIYEIYERELDNINSQKSNCEAEIDSIKNADIKNITIYDEEDIIEKNELKYQLLCINGERQIIAYQIAELSDSDANSAKLKELKELDETYEEEQTKIEEELQKLYDKYDK